MKFFDKIYSNKYIARIKEVLSSLKVQHQDTIWHRYAKWTMPIVTVLVILINWQIYSNVTEVNENTVENNAMEIVELQAKALTNIFESHKNTTQKLFRGFSMEKLDEYMKLADDFVKTHPSEYDGYLRLTFPDGKSYKSNTGLDTINFKGFSIPDRIFYHNCPFVITSPYDHVDGVKAVHYGIHSPLIVNDSVVAVITTTIPRRAIDVPISNLHLDGKGIPGMLVNETTNVVFFWSEYGVAVDTSGFKDAQLYGLEKVIDHCNRSPKDGRCISGNWERTLDGEHLDMTFYCAYIKGSNFGVNLAISTSEVHHNSHTLMIVIILLSLATIAALYLTLRFITQKIVLTPIHQANKFAKEFSEGNLYADEFSNIELENEFGVMKENMTVMKTKLLEVVENIRDAASDISQGNTSLNEMVKHIDQGAQLQASNTEEITASIESIMASVEQINENSKDAASISDEVSRDITTIAQYSQTTLETIQNVISKIAVINDITTRTDLLAINASVEAARAGEFGSGFGQVASEIRKLAEVCQHASHEINALSAQSLKITEISVGLISGIEPKVKENAQMVGDISRSCVEQISLAGSMSEPIQHLAGITSSNAQNAEELSQQVEILGDNCRKLEDSVKFFKTSQDKDSREQIIADISDCKNEIARLNDRLASIRNQKH